MESENKKNNFDEFKDYIDLKIFFYYLIKNKYKIFIFFIVGFLSSIFYIFTAQKVWQGQFQIVLNTKNGNESLGFGSGSAPMQFFSNTLNMNDSLKTEIEILKSPYVLIDVFNFVKSNKVKEDKSFNNLRFENWRNNSLDFKLKKDTSILKITYRDNKKELIEPVLKKISKKYEEYSGEKKRRKMELGENYFKNQISIYEKDSLISLKKAQEFASDQNFTMPILSSSRELNINDINRRSPNNSLTQVLDIESIKVRETDSIKFIKSQLSRINSLEEKSEEVVFIVQNIAENSMRFNLNFPSGEELLKKINLLDTEISQMSSIYTENDLELKGLQKERENLIKLLRLRLIGFLEASETGAKLRLKNASRPEGVIIEFKQLLNNALRDKKTLSKLENDYREFLLIKAKNEDPWKLITIPTLLPNNVLPQKKQSIFLGSFFGIFIGAAFAYWIEFKKNKVYFNEEIEDLFNWKLIYDFPVSKIDNWQYFIKLIFKKIYDQNIKQIALLPISNLSKEEKYKKLFDNFLKTEKNLKVIEIENLLDLTPDTLIICVCMKGYTRKDEIQTFNSDLSLLNNKIFGIVSIDLFN
jgi:uncharacterized protein involved in exopolysaccharide biosynthesis